MKTDWEGAAIRLSTHLNKLYAHLTVVVMHSEKPDFMGPPDIEQIKIDMKISNDAVNRLVREPLGYTDIEEVA